MNKADTPNTLRRWCADVLAGRGVVSADVIDQLGVEALLQVAEFEGVLPLMEWRLRRSVAWDALPEALRTGLMEGARSAAARELFREHELARLSRVLQEAGIRTLLLKGNALARWLYAQPHLRVSGDIDLLFDGREQALRAVDEFAGLGYALAYTVGEFNFEMTTRLMVDGVSRSELDLHYRLLNAAAYADIFPFATLWEQARALPRYPGMLRMLAPGHALAHACLNRALDMQVGVPDRLKLLYDIHLLVAGMDDRAWGAFLVMSTEKRITGVCLRSTRDAVDALGSAVPGTILQELESSAYAEPLDWRRLHDWRYMQWQNLRSLPGIGARLRWLWQRFFPAHGQLRELHGEGGWWRLMLRRAGRGLLRIVKRV